MTLAGAWSDPGVVPLRTPHARTRPGDDGFTLIELMVAITITLVLLAMVPTVMESVSHGAAYSQGVAAGAGQALTLVQELESRVESASQICLPTQLTTAGPTVSAGFAVRVLTSAFGQPSWDQWMLNTSTHVLEEQQWSTTWMTGNAVPPWITIGNSIVNSSTAPFASSNRGHRLTPDTHRRSPDEGNRGDPVPVDRVQVVGDRLRHPLLVEPPRLLRHRLYAGGLDVTPYSDRLGHDDRGSTLVLVLVISVFLIGVIAVSISTSNFSGTLSSQYGNTSQGALAAQSGLAVELSALRVCHRLHLVPLWFLQRHAERTRCQFVVLGNRDVLPVRDEPERLDLQRVDPGWEHDPGDGHHRVHRDGSSRFTHHHAREHRHRHHEHTRCGSGLRPLHVQSLGPHWLGNRE